MVLDPRFEIEQLKKFNCSKKIEVYKRLDSLMNPMGKSDTSIILLGFLKHQMEYFEYDKNHNPIVMKQYGLNGTLSEWRKTYDSHGNLLSTVFKKDTKITEKVTYKRTSKRRVLRRTQHYQDQEILWDTLVLNDQNRIIKIKRQHHFKHGSLEGPSEITYSYSDSGFVNQEIFKWKNSSPRYTIRIFKYISCR